MNQETRMIPERFGVPTCAGILECTGETGELFQDELLGEDVIKYLFSDKHLWSYSCVPGMVLGLQDTKLQKEHYSCPLKIPPPSGRHRVDWISVPGPAPWTSSLCAAYNPHDSLWQPEGVWVISFSSRGKGIVKTGKASTQALVW